ncbi:MAG: helix-turn-helix transcriptional regulator [Clostridiales bacterium]|nr:helix-turn-helix transcriptional regulator [Clostridiales bacterium]
MNKARMGARIKEARKNRRLTQDQLAAEVNIGPTYISDIERGAKFPSLSLFIKIVNALNVSADFILYGQLTPVKKFLYNGLTQKT